jgi:hypothetical protein
MNAETGSIAPVTKVLLPNKRSLSPLQNNPSISASSAADVFTWEEAR